MNINDLIELLKTEDYKFNYWNKCAMHRFYFNLKKHVDSFIEIEVHEDTVISYEAKCFYAGDKYSVTKKWVNNYLKDVNGFLEDVVYDIETIIITNEKN